MRLDQVKPLFEAPFSARNFPEEGNQQFTGAGERTNYIESDKNEQGFSLLKDVKVVPKDGGDRIELEKGTTVHITRPGKLFRGEQIGASPSTGVFTLISKRSPEEDDALGYAPLSSIQKPAGATQSRMQTGAGSQEAIAEYLKDNYDGEYEFVSTAKKGSTVPDLVVNLDGKPVQFEIKGASSPTAPITFFDKSVRRDQRVELLDNFAHTFSGGATNSFTELVDEYREENPEVGFPGDEGAPKSGKLPRDFQVTDDPQLLAKLRQDILDHFAEGNDNYFAIHNRQKEEIYIYHTGHGANPLDEDPLPELDQFKLATYGGPSAGAMRVGIKIKLARQ